MNPLKDNPAPDLRRRQLLRAAASLPVLALPAIGRATEPVARTLKFSHAHTGESLRVTYFENGAYLPDALDEINTFMRDFRTGEVEVIAPELLDYVHNIQLLAERQGPYTVFSAFRSPATNEMLRRNSSGVAKKSHHMKGEALDISLQGVSAKQVRDIAVSLRSGGVGLYSNSGFVHVDVGPVRQW
ncbi:MAG: DUF882 domain-containing protein [Gammaproteobacteria bacterium]|nr:DUF882 domain-containing protein [Gammaproteobacteria bacterium]NND53860.1 DUF882 domain-containing protein [Gammaproteobacteria bacterium]